MVRIKLNQIAGGAFLALALIGAQIAHADDKKTVLTRPLKAGVVTTYKATIKASVMGMDIVIEQSQKETIKSVKDDGTIVILSEDLGGKMTANGTEQEQKPGQPTTETRDKLGKLVDLVHEQDQGAPFTPEVQKLMSSIGELLMTDKEVGEGDSWETQLDNPVSKENKVKVKTTYQGIDKVAGVDLWKFKQTVEAIVDANGAKLAYETLEWVNPKDGLMEKTETKAKGVPSQIGTIDFTIAIQRVKAGDAAKADAKPDK